MATSLLPAIVVLNKKYFPADVQSAAQVGASSFTFSVLKVLFEARLLAGIVLYQRDEDVQSSYVDLGPQRYHDVPVATFHFNFRVPDSSNALALATAYAQIMTLRRAPSPPLVYYQTDALLHFHPAGVPFCVTHHGPFVADFARRFSPSAAARAFGGDAAKLRVLAAQQARGIQRLLRDDLGTVLAHSQLQQRVLEGQGLAAARFRPLRPPIDVPLSPNPNVLPTDIRHFVARAELLLFTAVARLDYFKNAELLVRAGLALRTRGVPAQILIVGDPADDDARRRALIASIPVAERGHFLIHPRLEKGALYALFAAARGTGVFVCASRYETLGITPLEAARAGVATLLPDADAVEAAAYVPARCRVPLHAEAIADRVQRMYREGVPRWARAVRAHVQRETGPDVFRRDLLAAWAHVSGRARDVLSERSGAADRGTEAGDGVGPVARTAGWMRRRSEVPRRPVPTVLRGRRRSEAWSSDRRVVASA